MINTLFKNYLPSKSRALVRIIHITLCLMLFSSTTASALSPAQKRVMQSGSNYFNVEATKFCEAATGTTAPPTGSLKSGSSVYMLGDSITNGANQKYRDAFTTAGITSYINAVGGRAWIWAGSSDKGDFTEEAGGAQKGKDAVEADGNTIASSDGIIIALGSNGGLEANPIADIITAIRTKNKTAPIWWVNVVASDTNKYAGSVNFGPFNSSLQDQYPTLGYTIIDWHGAVIPGSNPSDVPTTTILDVNNYLTSDGLHPTSTGQDALVALVVSSVTTGTESAPNISGCACSVANTNVTNGTPQENYQNTWNYFVTEKQLSMEAAAGIMGNLEAESGIDPHNTQNDAKDSSGNPVPDGPEIPFELIKNKYGYGIAQWTSIGRQQGLIDFAAKPPARSTGDLGLQLDFLWEELTTKYTGVLTKLQEPNVTLNAASDEVVLRFEIPASVLPKAGEASKQSTLEARRKRSETIFNTYSGLPAGSFANSSCASSTVVDLTDTDTTDVLCATGTTDAGIADGYNDGEIFKIRLCIIAGTGITLNSQLSGSVSTLITAAKSENITLSGGSFRTMEGQIDIYNKWCKDAGVTPTPPPYPKVSLDSYTKCPGGAPPGYSNHQMGFAIDFNCSGVLIPQEYAAASSNPCFIWLSANAGKYGLYELGKGLERDSASYEGWHWSVDGS